MKSKLIEKSAAINNKIAPVITLDLFDSLICCLSDFFLMSLVIFDLEKKSSGQARGFTQKQCCSHCFLTDLLF